MGHAETNRAERLGPKATMLHQEAERRLAGTEAGALERRPLIETDRDQHDAA
jgi:hypothetical protein